MTWKDCVLLIAGGLLGVPVSMTASIILGQALTITCGFSTVKFLAKLRQNFRRDIIFDGQWMEEWTVVSNNYEPVNRGTLNTYRFLHLLAAETEHKTRTDVTDRGP